MIDGSPYVFATTRKTRKLGPSKFDWRHFNSWNEPKRELDKLLPSMPNWTIHDLRRTARTLMAEIGVPDHIAEKVEGHKSTGHAPS